MELEQIKKKIIETAINDYENDPKYNILNIDLLENIVFTLKHAKGNKTYSNEQAQIILKDIKQIITLRENFISKIQTVKRKKEEDTLDTNTIVEMNKAKRELLDATTSSLEDFFAGNADLEEVKWLKNVSYNEDKIINLLQEEYKKLEEKTIDFKTLTQNIDTLLDTTILSSNAYEVRRFCEKIYKKEIEIRMEDLQKKAKEYIESVSVENIDKKEVSIKHNELKESKQKLDEVKAWAKKVNPSFQINDLFNEEEISNNPVISWYKEQQNLEKEVIIKAQENAIKENASLKEQAEITIILCTNEQAEAIIVAYEQKKKETESKENTRKQQKPTEEGYEQLKNKFQEVLKTLNEKIIECNNTSPSLLTLEAAILTDIKIGNFKNVNNFLQTNAYIESLEEQIITMKTELAKIDCQAFRQYKYFVTNDIATNIETMVSSMSKEDVETFASKRKNTIDELKMKYDACMDEKEKELLKGIIFAEQTIKARRIMEEQRANSAFDGVSYIKKYENHITFSKSQNPKTNNEVRTDDVKTYKDTKVKAFKVKIKDIQDVSTNSAIIKEVPPVLVNIAENKLRIEYSKALKEELQAAKYDIDIRTTQIKTETEVQETEEKTKDKIIKSYDLTNIDKSSFNIAIVFRDLITNTEAKRFILIREGVITKQVLNEEEVEPKMLAR